SLFYYDYDDVQTFVRDDGGAIPVQRLGNIDHARVMGGDLDIAWRPMRGLDLFAGIGLIDTRLSAFATAAGPVAAGNELPNAPNFTFTGRARSYWLFDARLAFGAADDRWEIALWGRNLSDNRHVVQGLDVASLGFGNRTYNAPRTYGVTGTIRF